MGFRSGCKRFRERIIGNVCDWRMTPVSMEARRRKRGVAARAQIGSPRLTTGMPRFGALAGQW
jgi:hypothetical protein